MKPFIIDHFSLNCICYKAFEDSQALFHHPLPKGYRYALFEVLEISEIFFRF